MFLWYIFNGTCGDPKNRRFGIGVQKPLNYVLPLCCATLVELIKNYKVGIKLRNLNLREIHKFGINVKLYIIFSKFDVYFKSFKLRFIRGAEPVIAVGLSSQSLNVIELLPVQVGWMIAALPV